MPYCPKCLSEYVEGLKKCEDCGILLLAGSPPPTSAAIPPHGHQRGVFAGLLQSLMGAGKPDDSQPVKTVRVRTFSGPTARLDAELARNILETQGIPSILPGEASVELLPFLEMSLLVRAEDAERAARILKDYFDQTGLKLVE